MGLPVAHPVKVLVAKSGGLSWIPGTLTELSCELSSDLHPRAGEHSCMHTQTQYINAII